MAQARFTHPRRRDDPDRARHRVGDARGEDRLEHTELLLATDARRRLTQQPAHILARGWVLLAEELGRAVIALDMESPREQVLAQLVQPDPALGRRALRRG